MKPVEIIKNQLGFNPILEGVVDPVFKSNSRKLAAGLGGSRLAGGVLQSFFPRSNVESYSCFGLSEQQAEKYSAVIASSASGSVPEVISVFKDAVHLRLPLSVVSKGGELISLAKEGMVPYVMYPEINVPPRESVLFSLLGHLKILGLDSDIESLKNVVTEEAFSSLSQISEELVSAVSGKQVLLYGPDMIEGLLRVFKINFNETARIPAFISMVPEALHGEIAAFDGSEHTAALSKSTTVLIFMYPEMDERITKRMHVLQSTLDEYGISSHRVTLPSASWEGIVYGIALSMTIAHALREKEGISRDGANLIARFKEKTSLL